MQSEVAARDYSNFPYTAVLIIPLEGTVAERHTPAMRVRFAAWLALLVLSVLLTGACSDDSASAEGDASAEASAAHDDAAAYDDAAPLTVDASGSDAGGCSLQLGVPCGPTTCTPGQACIRQNDYWFCVDVPSACSGGCPTCDCIRNVPVPEAGTLRLCQPADACEEGSTRIVCGSTSCDGRPREMCDNGVCTAGCRSNCDCSCPGPEGYEGCGCDACPSPCFTYLRCVPL